MSVVGPATSLGDAVEVGPDGMRVRDAAAVRARVEALVREAVFAPAPARERARWLLWELAHALEVRPASLHGMARARARGEGARKALPVINLRGPAYLAARAVFRAARRRDAGAFVLAITRAEIAHSDQRPGEFVAAVLGAALREEWRGPVFLQVDHLRADPVTWGADPAGELAALKQLAREAVDAGLYNVAVDASTLVRADATDPETRQAPNAIVTAEVVADLRQWRTGGTPVAVGGDLGTPDLRWHAVDELRAYLDRVEAELVLRGVAPGDGLAAVGVRPLAGAPARPGDPPVEAPREPDLAALVAEARRHGLAGTVHYAGAGAALSVLASYGIAGAAEVHVGPRFQPILFQHLPAGLRAAMDAWAEEEAGELRRPDESTAAAVERARWRALGPFKRALWELDADDQDALGAAYEDAVGALFDALGAGGTGSFARRHAGLPAAGGRFPRRA